MYTSVHKEKLPIEYALRGVIGFLIYQGYVTLYFKKLIRGQGDGSNSKVIPSKVLRLLPPALIAPPSYSRTMWPQNPCTSSVKQGLDHQAWTEGCLLLLVWGHSQYC